MAFDDGVGEVSGAWVTGRPPSDTPGLMIYIMVDSVSETIRKIIAAGGETIPPPCGDSPEIIAFFSDPGGNVIGLYQEPASAQ